MALETPQSSINPWIRSEQELLNHETYALIHPEKRDQYLIVMGRLAVTGGALNDQMPNPSREAREDYNQAQQARHAFFEDLVLGFSPLL